MGMLHICMHRYKYKEKIHLRWLLKKLNKRTGLKLNVTLPCRRSSTITLKAKCKESQNQEVCKRMAYNSKLLILQLNLCMVCYLQDTGYVLKSSFNNFHMPRVKFQTSRSLITISTLHLKSERCWWTRPNSLMLIIFSLNLKSFQPLHGFFNIPSFSSNS